MKILINISVINKNHRGMGIFTKQVVKELLLNNHHEYIFVSGNDLDIEMDQIIQSNQYKYIQIKTPLPFFEQIIIPYLIFKHKPNLCWFPSNTFPIVKILNTKYVATIHDLIFLRNDIKVKTVYQAIGKLYRKYNILLGLKKLDLITSVSETSLNEISKLLNIRLNNNQVLYNNFIPKNISDKESLNKLQLKKTYIYTITGIAPHKNLDFLIKSFLRFNQIYSSYTLVVSGAINSKYVGQYPDIIFTSFISEEEKVYLIQHAELFVFTSLVEGFGIPLIEGLYYNNKVLVSDIDIFREIGKQYVSYFIPNNENFLIDYFKNSETININHKEAKEYILNHFNSKKTTKKLEDIFDGFK